MDNNVTLPIVLSVVGHTNTGKTSLVRTLLRSPNFGQVDNRGGTTRHVESAQIMFGNQPFLELRDTPGLEDSVALAEQLKEYLLANDSGRTALLDFVEDKTNDREFNQELKVVNQVLISDIILYVVDCREPVLEKYMFELQCLGMAARPIIPVLNFIEEGHNYKSEWRKVLADFNFHSLVEFDTVAFSFDAEKRLYRKFQTVLEPYYALLESFIADREANWQTLKKSCIDISSDFLLSASKAKIVIDEKLVVKDQLEQFKNSVREKEKHMIKNILQLLEFSTDDISYAKLPIENGRWSLDLFAPEAVKKFGIDTASAAATGAAIGAGLDLMFAGMSLGAATAAGAAIGTSWSAAKRFGKSILAKYRGQYTVGLDEQTMMLLLARQVYLLDALFHRGHAAQKQLKVDQGSNTAKQLDYLAPVKALKKLQNLAIDDNETFSASIKQVITAWFISALADDQRPA